MSTHSPQPIHFSALYNRVFPSLLRSFTLFKDTRRPLFHPHLLLFIRNYAYLFIFMKKFINKCLSIEPKRFVINCQIIMQSHDFYNLLCDRRYQGFPRMLHRRIVFAYPRHLLNLAASSRYPLASSSSRSM
jgi:hypothetical protein